MRHLTIRVAWHDSRWTGGTCAEPSRNTYCLALDRIREERGRMQAVGEDCPADELWAQIGPSALPPCVAESGAFMCPTEWAREFRHPYLDNPKAQATHGHLQPTRVTVPPYSTFAVPFRWMNRDRQSEIDESLPHPLPPDEKPPFPTPWVFGSARQEALLELMFSQVQDEESLVFFYCKEGTPLGDTYPRLVVAVGKVIKVSLLLKYETPKTTTYPLWDRIIRHSMRPDGHEGFVLPYHDYLATTGDPDEDARRITLLQEIAVDVAPNHYGTFSYVAELASHDAALSTLVRCLKSVRRIREHGIAKGPWERREEWLNEQISSVWKDRGAFPGLGSALEALGMRLGTALVQDLLAREELAPNDNPWPLMDAVLRGATDPPDPSYRADIDAIRTTWVGLDANRRQLLELLSRFDLTPRQAIRWFDIAKRTRSTTSPVDDGEILSNPYRMSEVDMGEQNDPPVAVGTIDRGLLPDSTVVAQHPISPPAAVGSYLDARRVRAALVAVLRAAGTSGDSLLSVTEAIERLQRVDLAHPCNPTLDWLSANLPQMEGVVELLQIPAGQEADKIIPALQLTEYKQREDWLRKTLRSRAERTHEPLDVDWPSLLVKSIRASGGAYDQTNPRHAAALEEQAKALAGITERKLSVLVGRAGTGKTSVLGALLLCPKLVADGILLLAPTGKARVRLGKATRAEAMTVAQFLFHLGRYDGARQRPLFSGETYRREKTVVVDECSMLTMDDLAALLQALDLAHVQRIILVGDPNQLPPIGVGRPFADLVASLEEANDSSGPEQRNLGGALSRLTVEVRATAQGPSDTLRLATWFTRDPQPVDADRVLSDLELKATFNDLELVTWKTPEDLRDKLLEQFQKQLGLSKPDDVKGMDRALGFAENGLLLFEAPEGAENFQILSPVRMHPHGVYELNRWMQQSFRATELRSGRQPWGQTLGDEEIVIRDKVIQIRNEWRSAWDGTSTAKLHLANGEIGIVAHRVKRQSDGKALNILNVVFAGRPGYRVGYRPSDFPTGSGPLELAYALTVHKAQGSEFRYVFVILPAHCRLISRELLYTALTRSRDRLILLVQGDDLSSLYDFSRPESSETARRNTNLFRAILRERVDDIPYAEHLIHRTEKGHMVRSKSELVIANMLFHMGMEYEYERRLEGERVPGTMRPDFSFVDPAGDLVLWEHLGMLKREDYRQGWEWKRDWYTSNGFVLGQNLFSTEDDERGGLDSTKVREVANRIQGLL